MLPLISLLSLTQAAQCSSSSWAWRRGTPSRLLHPAVLHLLELFCDPLFAFTPERVTINLFHPGMKERRMNRWNLIVFKKKVSWHRQVSKDIQKENSPPLQKLCKANKLTSQYTFISFLCCVWSMSMVFLLFFSILCISSSVLLQRSLYKAKFMVFSSVCYQC